MPFLRAMTAAAAATGLLLAVACSTQAEQDRGSCNSRSYAIGGAHTVICPGTSACSCAAPNVCCLAKLDSTAGECVDPRTCAGVLLTCDGPEDCGGGVCCLSGGESTCTAAPACTGVWLCREDSECSGSPGGPHCNPADYGVQGVTDRGLDGLIGVCGA